LRYWVTVISPTLWNTEKASANAALNIITSYFEEQICTKASDN
jgi:hypothetical protein